MELRENLELIEIRTDDTGERAYFDFLDAVNGEICPVSFNRQKWSEELGQFAPDNDKAKQVDEWMDTYFKTTWDKKDKAIGQTHNVYVYDNFYALWECSIIDKFDVSDKGLLFTTVIDEVVDTGYHISIRFTYNGTQYQSKMNYSQFSETQKKSFVVKTKKTKQYNAFKEKFGVDVENADTLIGKEITVEVRVAMKKYAFCEIKKPNWK